MEGNTSSYYYPTRKVVKKTIVSKEYDEQGRVVKEVTEEIEENPEYNYTITYNTVPEPPFTAK